MPYLLSMLCLCNLFTNAQLKPKLSRHRVPRSSTFGGVAATSSAASNPHHYLPRIMSRFSPQASHCKCHRRSVFNCNAVCHEFQRRPKCYLLQRSLSIVGRECFSLHAPLYVAAIRAHGADHNHNRSRLGSPVHAASTFHLDRDIA